MGSLSRNKGKAGERELASLLSALTGYTVARRVRQHDGDDDLVAGWWAQAQRQTQATGTKPVLLYRADSGAWTAVWPACLHTLRAPDCYPVNVVGDGRPATAVAHLDQHQPGHCAGFFFGVPLLACKVLGHLPQHG